MREGATFALTFLAFALLHAARPQRLPAGLAAHFPRTWGGLAARASAALLLVAAVAAWAPVEDTAAALLVVAGALCLAATTFVVLVGLFPRITWTVALACGPAALALSLLAGGCRG